jgi:DNA-binding MarR family transcriptional regulator
MKTHIHFTRSFYTNQLGEEPNELIWVPKTYKKLVDNNKNCIYKLLKRILMKPSASHQKMVNAIAAKCLSVRLRLMNRMVGAIYDEGLRPHGIKASQLNILVAVSAFGKVTSKELCRVLHMDPSTFSRAVARLKDKGLLQIEPSGEGKILQIEVTQNGFNKIERVYPEWQRAQEKAAEVLGQSTSEMVIAAGNRHLLGGMTG